jgi:DNA-binding NarL/FixJ family response regulator
MRTLLIVDEQPVVHRGIEAILQDAGLAVRTAGAGSAAEVLAALEAQGWDAVVIDIGQSDSVGIGLVARIAKEHPRLPILIFTLLSETAYGARALRAGANGFLHKTAAPGQLVDALRQIVAGQQYMSVALAAQMAEADRRVTDEAAHDMLTDRELEIFRLIAIGKAVAEIGNLLNIRPKTVHAHRANILRKTGLPDNRALARYAFQQQLIPERRSRDSINDKQPKGQADVPQTPRASLRTLPTVLGPMRSGG